MKFDKVVLGLVAILFAAPSFGYQLKCVNDQLAVDGDFQKIVLTFDDTGRGQMEIVEQAESPAASHKEDTLLRALSCESSPSHGEINIQCDGPITVDVSEIELFGTPGGQPFTRKVIVSTSFQEKSFSFNRGSIGTGPTKSGCEVINK